MKTREGAAPRGRRAQGADGQGARAWGVGWEQGVNPQDATWGDLRRTPALSTAGGLEVNAKSPTRTSANVAPAEAAGPRLGEPSDPHTRPRHSAAIYLENAFKHLAVSGGFTTAGCLADLSSASKVRNSVSRYRFGILRST